MNFQKTFAFVASSCPIDDEVWRNAEAAITVVWGDCTVTKKEYDLNVFKDQPADIQKLIVVCITAQTVTELGECCFDFCREIMLYKQLHSEYKFYHAIVMELKHADQKQNFRKNGR